jgi:hypothetical protein
VTETFERNSDQEPKFLELIAARENTQAQTPVTLTGVASEADLDPVAFVRNRLGFEPDPPQIEVLQCTHKQGILNCSRQWGKSTVTAAKAVHRAYTQPGSEILVAAYCQRQSAEFLRKASRMVAKLDFVRAAMAITRSLCFSPTAPASSACRATKAACVVSPP